MNSKTASFNNYDSAGTTLRRLPKTGILVLMGGVFLLLAQLSLPAEQLTTVGIVDINRIYNSFYRDSQAVRDLERVRREYQAEINAQVAELQTLRDRRARMAELGNDARVQELDQEIADMQRFLEDLTQRRRRQLETRQQNLLSNEFLQELQEAIQFVAQSEGFTIVLRSDVQGLQWWAVEVDISEKVVQRLIQVADR